MSDIPLEVSNPVPANAHGLSRANRFFARHWLGMISFGLGVLVILPIAAPILMHLGWYQAGFSIYHLYSYLCHQLPERSYYLFGTMFMHPLSEIQAAWKNTSDASILRMFDGNPTMGWKIAWSDRMVAMYTSAWLFGIAWWAGRKRLDRFNFKTLLALTLPLVIDGFTHTISDLAGIEQGFRETNTWLRIITQNLYSTSFYTGNAWGSFNAWVRLISGVLFGLGIVGYFYPRIEEKMDEWSRTRYIDAGDFSPELRADKQLPF